MPVYQLFITSRSDADLAQAIIEAAKESEFGSTFEISDDRLFIAETPPDHLLELAKVVLGVLALIVPFVIRRLDVKEPANIEFLRIRVKDEILHQFRDRSLTEADINIDRFEYDQSAKPERFIARVSVCNIRFNVAVDALGNVTANPS